MASALLRSALLNNVNGKGLHVSPFSLLLVAIALCGSINATGQYFTNSHNSIHFQNRSYGFITELPPAPPETRGDGYWYDEVIVADVFMKDSTMLQDLPVRIDMLAERIEITHMNQVKVLPFRSILKIHLKKPTGTEVLVSSSVLNHPDKKAAKLFQVVTGKKVLLLSTMKAEVVKANYNMALDVGRRDNEVILKRIFFLYDGKSFLEVDETRAKFRKAFLKNFGERYENVVKDVNPKKMDDLIALVGAIDTSGS